MPNHANQRWANVGPTVLPPQLARRYLLCRQLGEGAYARVHLAADRIASRQVVIKHVLRQSRDSTLSHEYNICHGLRHDRIVNLIDYVQQDGEGFIVMEYVAGSDMYARVEPKGKGFTEDEARQWWLDVAEGLSYMHSRGVVHCDVKPENILLDVNGRAKLCDFGLAQRKGTVLHGKMPGTCAYMAPERLQAEQDQSDFVVAEAEDVWGLGLVFYATLYADLPWDIARPSDPDYATFLAMKGEIADEAPFGMLSRELSQLLGRMLCPDPKRRCGLQEVVDFCRSSKPWFATSLRRNQSSKRSSTASIRSEGAHSTSGSHVHRQSSTSADHSTPSSAAHQQASTEVHA